MTDDMNSDVLKEVNQAERASRPAPKAKGSAFVEYLYTTSYGEMGDDEVRQVRFQITKRTAKRIYFLVHKEYLNADGSFDYAFPRGNSRDEKVDFIDRAKVETDTGAFHKRLCDVLYITFEASARATWKSEHEREQAAKMKPASAVLPALKEAIDARTRIREEKNEALIAAREKYNKAQDETLKVALAHRQEAPEMRAAYEAYLAVRAAYEKAQRDAEEA